MSSTTTQGHGNGAAFDNKGPQNSRNQFVPLVGPRILTAGIMTMTGSAIAVQCPSAIGLAATAVSVLVRNSSNSNAVTIAKNTSNSKITSITLDGTNTDVIEFMVIANGLGA